MMWWIALMLSCAAAYGQQKAQLAGFILDRSGAIVPNASVSVIQMETGTRRSVRSNSEGFYAVSSLSAGMYKITIRKDGFQTLARVSVPLQATEAARFDFTLDIGSMQEVVTVEGASPMLNVTDATSGVQVGTEAVEKLPLNGRALQGLIELAPGVLATPANAGEAGQFSTNGQRPTTNYFTVDGVSANNGVSGSGLPGQFSGGALPSMTAIGSLHNLASLGAVQELRVQTSTFAPESGRLPGAHVAITTRSGSNELHGEVFGSFRHNALMANDWFASRAGLEKGAHRLTDFGALLGGPLQRDRTFGFISFERLRLLQPASFDTLVPATASRAGWLSVYPVANGPEVGQGAALYTAQVSSPATVTTMNGRLDRTLSDIGTMFVRYSRAPSRSENGFLQRNDTKFTSQTFTAGVITLAAGGRLTNDARISVSRTVVSSNWLAGQAGALDLEQILGSPGDGQRLYGLSVRGIPPIVTGDPGASKQTQWNLVDSIALPLGRHDLRFGIDYQRLTPERRSDIVGVVGQFESIDDVIAGHPAELTYSRASAGSSLIETFSVFAQDTWHVTPRLNVTYGLRWELTPPPAYRTQPPPAVIGSTPILPPIVPPPLPPGELAGNASNQPLWRSRYTQFAPRFGAAYRLNDSGSLVVRTGFGLFYDLGFSSAMDLLNGAPYNRWRSLLGPTFSPVTEAVYGFDRNLRLPYSLEWNTTLERAIGSNAAASAAYVGSSGRRLLRREAHQNAMPTPDLILATNHGSSNYHALQLQARSRSRRGVQGVISYTWSRAIDNGSWDSGTFVIFPDLGASQDRGRSNFDVRHSFQAALSYTLPSNWIVSGMLRTRTGFPIDVVTLENPFGYGFDNLRPDLVGKAWIDDPNAPGGRRLNPLAFVKAATGQGTLGRNSIEGFGLAQLDMAVEREWALQERGRVRLRMEAYNVTNQASFADPTRFLSSPMFGVSSSLSGLMMGAGRPNSGLSPAFQPGGPRSLQASITLRF